MLFVLAQQPGVWGEAVKLSSGSRRLGDMGGQRKEATQPCLQLGLRVSA